MNKCIAKRRIRYLTDNSWIRALPQQDNGPRWAFAFRLCSLILVTTNFFALFTAYIIEQKSSELKLQKRGQAAFECGPSDPIFQIFGHVTDKRWYCTF